MVPQASEPKLGRLMETDPDRVTFYVWSVPQPPGSGSPKVGFQGPCSSNCGVCSGLNVAEGLDLTVGLGFAAGLGFGAGSGSAVGSGSTMGSGFAVGVGNAPGKAGYPCL